MDINLLTIIGIGLVAMFFGYFFGLFEGRSQGYKRRKKEEAAEKPAVPAAAETPDISAEPQAPTPAVVDKSMLRLSLDPDQRPVLEMDGRPVNISAIGADQRKRLIDLMLVMRPWVEAAPAPRPSAVPQPPTASTEAAPSSGGPLADRLAAAAGPTPPPSSAPKPAAVPAALRPVAVREPPEPGTPTTMVGQIDAILQARLAGSSLAGHAIRVVESSEGGAAIVVDKQRYAGVGDVPDPEIKAVIKAAIAEW